MEQALQALTMLVQRSIRYAAARCTPARWYHSHSMQQLACTTDAASALLTSISPSCNQHQNVLSTAISRRLANKASQQARQISTAQPLMSGLQGSGLSSRTLHTQPEQQQQQQQQQQEQGVSLQNAGEGEGDSPTPQGTASSTNVASQAPDLAPELLSIMSQPLPLGSTVHRSLNNLVVRMNDCYFLDPRATLQSTMRAFLVIRQVLRSNGQICVVNTNPAFTPLMQHAARHCTNPNMWWHWKEYQPGMLLRHPTHMLSDAAQPARKILQRNGLAMVNVHCPRPAVMDQPTPKLDILDKWRLWSTPKTTPSGVRGRQLLQRVMMDEIQSAQLLLPGAGNQQFAPTLIVLLDLSHGQELLADAHEAGILTASVVNAHSSLERITYPIYAAEAHPSYTHFFLNWLLKVANLPGAATTSNSL